MAKLKVFSAPQGFYETIVAAPSQKAALEAWGTRQNLFAEGMAKVETDAAAVKAALAHPGQVLQRPAGGRDAFKPAAQAAAPKVPPKPKAAPKAKAPPKPKPKPKPDRSALTEAERALEAARAAGRSELADLQREREELESREREAIRRLDRETKALEKAREKAERAYVRAGGSVEPEED
jgi:hypothetical protein